MPSSLSAYLPLALSERDGRSTPKLLFILCRGAIVNINQSTPENADGGPRRVAD
jgi:hypothetical protein